MKAKTEIFIKDRADPFVKKGSDGYYYFTASYPMYGEKDPEGYDRIILRRAKTVSALAGAEEKIIWDASGGLIRTDDTIHSVQVPKSELQGNSYQVVSQQVGYKFGYNAFKRRTVESKEYNFNGVPKQDDIKILSISDLSSVVRPSMRRPICQM